MKEQHTIQTHTQTYRFEFGTDGILYTISFKAFLPKSEICSMLEIVSSTLYEKCGAAIRSYLDSHHREYSDFRSDSILLGHAAVMEAARHLLHDNSCGILDHRIGNADEYYAVMDHHWETGENYCEGCYLAISRTSTGQEKSYSYNIIGQTYWYDRSADIESAFFAVRQNKGSNHIDTIDKAEGDPVLATFGCIDMMSLLINIRDIKTKQQAASLAHR